MEDDKPRLEAVVFDLDDTLAPCKKDYVQMRAELLVWMSGVFEPMLSEEFGMKKGSLVRKARSVQRTVKREGILTRDVYEIIDGFFEGDEDAGIAWSHLGSAIDIYHENRREESLMERTRRLQEPILEGAFLRVGLELLKNAPGQHTQACARSNGTCVSARKREGLPRVQERGKPVQH